jgi:THUMP domain-like
VLLAQRLKQCVPHEHDVSLSSRLSVVPTSSDVNDEVAGTVQRGNVRQPVTGLEFDAARAQICHAPAVVEARPACVSRHAVQPEVIQDSVHVEVEAVAHDDRQPAVPVRPVDQLKEAAAYLGNRPGMRDELLERGPHEIERGRAVLLDRLAARSVSVAVLPPLRRGEPFEEGFSDVLCRDRPIEVEADHVRHSAHDSSPPHADVGHTTRVDLARARYLVSDRGRGALDYLGAGLGGLDPNRLSAALRSDHAPAEAAALAEQVTLRAKALERVGERLDFLFSADGLEMMTHPIVARRRAARLATVGAPIIDLTCGIGGDLAACAATGVRSAGVERDGPTALLAAHNVTPGEVTQGEAARAPFDLAQSAVVLDPSRRAASTRRFDPSAFSPDWDTSLALLRSAVAGVLKTAPGIDHGHIPPWAEAEFVQLGRSMREAALWAGAEARPGLLRAVLLPAGVTIDSAEPEVPPEPVPPGQFLFDPESCVTRAGLVRQLAAVLDARLLDPQLAYLTASEPAFHPMAATFEVLDALPFSIARLKQRLRERRWRPHEIRRRAFPIEPDELRRLLGRIEGEPITVFLTTIAGKRSVFIGRRHHPASA